MKNVNWILLLIALGIAGCGSAEIRPVDIFPEDMCGFCRMAISDDAFAAEIITADGEAVKFDDIGCMDEYVRNSEIAIAARFVKDFESRGWLLHNESTIVRTSVSTPMGSGKIAFADPLKAKKFAEYHPAPTKQPSSCCPPGTH